ncbi:hypothetical protein [Vagococcus luciliae]|uniref:Uncharacterized protein n=1 Tax=Vagococcus luciliae TaxID=2920380 RepID=A0ABY5P1J0_9ENTE|nr:hypothetical protein [Vagococcus luciliae]UUV99770.1 hypothetical protein G314FT_19390 [Vagococcus luciliae]
MQEKEWVLNELSLLKRETQTYEVSAFLNELEDILSEQYKRIEQAKAELDGLLWSPNEW